MSTAAQESPAYFRVPQQFPPGTFIAVLAQFQDVAPVADRQTLARILLDHQHRQAYL